MTFIAFLLCSVAAIGTDATSAWESSGRPLIGIHDAGEWVLSCICEPVDPDGANFSDVDLGVCKQEAVTALLEHYAGRPTIPAAVPEEFRPLVESSVANWHVARVQATGMTWVKCQRSATSNLVVLAVPTAVCKAIPKQGDWMLSLPEVANSTTDWIVPAALLEACDDRSRERVQAIAIERLGGAVERAADRWPAGFLKLPHGVPSEVLAKLSLADMVKVAATRPGDAAIWELVAKRCEASHLVRAAEIVRGLGRNLKWPQPAPTGVGKPWSDVPVGDLPTPLVGIVRAGGAIACRASSKSEACRAALTAFSAMTPNVALAESKAREAAVRPEPDALNILAAIRLADPQADGDTLRHALAFAWQARVLAPDHQYAAVNVLRAMRRLGMRDDAATFLKTVPPAEEGTWAHRELTSISEWLVPKDRQDVEK